MSFVSSVLAKAQKVLSGTLLVCGDFNCNMDPKMDVRSVKTPSPSARQIRQGTKFFDLLQSYGLYDVWRVFHPGERDFSFHSMVHNSYTRIDYIFMPGDTLPRVLDCSLSDITWSDHAPLLLTLHDSYRYTNRPPWKLNESLLSDPAIEKDLEQIMTEYFDLNATPDMSADILWLAHKAVLRGACIKWASHLNKTRRTDRVQLLTQIQHLSRVNKLDPSATNLGLLSAAQAQLTELNQKRLLFFQKRTQAKYYAFSNKPGRLLANCLRVSQPTKNISHLVTGPGGQKVFKPQDISNELAAYYSKLYNLQTDEQLQSHPSELIDKYLSSLHLPSLSPSQSQALASPITLQDVRLAINQLPLHKSPGPDGFSDGYYRKFAGILAPRLLSVFHSAAANGVFPIEMLRTVIVPLPKQGKTPTVPANFRPISLLNIDVKLYAKILADRIAAFLPALVCNDQVGFIRGRQGPHNTKKIIGLQSVAHRSGLPCIVMALDAEKAFDRVCWAFLRRVLDKFGFPEAVITNIFALYNHPTAAVIQAGFLSEPFEIFNGTRQGCPLSPLLYALAVEPLAQHIRQDSLVSGIDIGPDSFKISLFADDVLLTLTNPLTSLPRLHSVLAEYSKVSYHKVNVSKSQIMPIHVPIPVLKLLKNIYPYEWRTDYINYLGVKLTASPFRLYDYNYKPFLSKLRQIFYQWRHAKTSWVGRVSSIKMTILPKLLYLFRTLPLPLPTSYLEEIQSYFLTYVWRRGRPRVPAKLLYLSRCNGGMAMPNVTLYYNATLLASMGEFFLQSSTPRWTSVEQTCVGTHLVTSLIWLTPKQRPELPYMLPSTALYLKTWDRYRSRLLNNPFPSLATPTDVLRYWIDGFPCSRWVGKGVTHLWHLVLGDSLASFANLSGRYGLPDTFVFSYRQLHSLWKTTNLPNILVGSKVILTGFESFVLNPEASTRLVSLCYAALNALIPNYKWNFQKAWEKEIWHKADKGAYSCTSLREVRRKVMYRWYLVPPREKHITGASSTCWRCLSEVGTMLHVWWACKDLQTLWQDTAELVTGAVGDQIPVTPEGYLLGALSSELSVAQRKMFNVIISVVLLLVARHWKKTAVPSIVEVRKMITSMREYELQVQVTSGLPPPQKDHWLFWDLLGSS
uniref:Reverse transcriptase domain-containing protein n=1 Tax=Leptobrachium leishanense TaxID=445787 RepID=A0A8C5Q824_9ANUR